MNYFTGKKIIIVTKSNQMIHKNLYSKSGSIAVPVLECLSFTPAFSLSTNHRDFNANVKYITRLFNILQTLSSNICKFLKQFLTIKRGGPLLYYQQRNHQESIPLVWILRGTLYQEDNTPITLKNETFSSSFTSKIAWNSSFATPILSVSLESTT